MIPEVGGSYGAATVAGTRVMALLPFLVEGAMPLEVLREMRRRGMDVVIAFFLDRAQGLAPDLCQDFDRDGRLVDMTKRERRGVADRLDSLVDEHETQLVLQIGSPCYPHLPGLKDRHPNLRIVDWLFNSGPHFQSFTYRAGVFDGCLVESDEMAGFVAGIPGVGEIRQVESGVDLAEFVPRGRSVEEPSPDLVVGYVGRMSPEKNPFGFIEMAEGVLARQPWMRFVIYGSGVEADEVNDRVQGSPSRDSIRYGGFVDHPGVAFAEIDVLVVPSIMDGRPATVMQASASGVPVLGAPVGGIPELIYDGVNGHLVSPTDPYRIAELLAHWRHHPEEFRQLRQLTRALAESLFDRDRMMDGYAAAFAHWVDTPARPLALVEERSIPASLDTRDGKTPPPSGRTSHAAYIAQYDVPVIDPSVERPTLNWRRCGLKRDLSEPQRAQDPRLAYIDSHFPWQRSGFRYADALALLEAKPDTVFFSMYEMRDPFPAPVMPLAEFPEFALSLGITDIYGVFLGFMAGVLGLRDDSKGEPGPIEGIDLSEVLRYAGIRAHVGLYPGGGFVASEAGFAAARRLVAAADTVFTWSPSVLENVKGVTAIDPAIIDTTFYPAIPRQWTERPLQLLFVADASPRKGVSVALAALHVLADEPVHLHLVGPHDPRSWTGSTSRVTFHGWLQREELRELHRRCHVFVSPVGRDSITGPSGDGVVTDGFPTAAAGEAVSSGCLLVSANPDADHRSLRPSVDYIEVPATSTAFADAVRSVLADPATAAAVAASGATRIRERLDVRVGAVTRLELMGLTPDRPASTSTGPA